MQLDAILEVAIGLILTWLIISMATSQFQEAIVESLGWRSTFLEHRLQEMFQDPALVEQFYKHPLIESLSARTFWGKKRKPKGIPNPIFAKAAVDVFSKCRQKRKRHPSRHNEFGSYERQRAG